MYIILITVTRPLDAPRSHEAKSEPRVKRRDGTRHWHVITRAARVSTHVRHSGNGAQCGRTRERRVFRSVPAGPTFARVPSDRSQVSISRDRTAAKYNNKRESGCYSLKKAIELRTHQQKRSNLWSHSSKMQDSVNTAELHVNLPP